MSSKMTTYSQLSTTESKKNKNKNTLSKQPEQEQNHRYGGHKEAYQLGGKQRRMSEKVQGLKSINWYVQNRQQEVRNGKGNEQAKEFICMTHGHELKGGIVGGERRVLGRGGQRGKLGQL